MYVLSNKQTKSMFKVVCSKINVFLVLKYIIIQKLNKKVTIHVALQIKLFLLRKRLLLFIVVDTITIK